MKLFSLKTFALAMLVAVPALAAGKMAVDCACGSACACGSDCDC